MQIKMLETTNCDGKRVIKGEVVDASSKDGGFLIATGQAVAYEAEKKPAQKRGAKKAPVNRAIKDDEIDTK